MKQEKNIITEFNIRIKQLMYYCDSLKEENTRLIKEISSREEEIALKLEEIDKLKLDFSNLRFAKSLSLDDTDYKDEARKRLARLVRDVDKCISLLKT